jgi:hypothetical protein
MCFVTNHVVGPVLAAGTLRDEKSDPFSRPADERQPYDGGSSCEASKVMTETF